MIQLFRKARRSQDLRYVLGLASVGASIAIWNAHKGGDHAHAGRFVVMSVTP